MRREFLFLPGPQRDTVKIALRGRDVLSDPMINQGTAFTHEERAALGITGLLPGGVMSMEEQIRRVYKQYQSEPTNLAKYTYLNSMRDRNEFLFYRLLTDHIEEMMPIIYTPTIGEAIQEYSHWFHRPRGIYLDIDNPELIESSLLQDRTPAEDIELIVVTDSEGILGIGDQGVGGVAITIGKLSVYVAAAGVHPHHVLPVVLDTGTDNLDLLSDPAYLGVQHPRVRGEEYDEFINKFVKAVKKLFPNAMLHWEDFAAGNATRILNRYRDEICSFNDDIQGTASVVVAAILSAIRSSGTKICEQQIVINGAGSAGIGIANQLVNVMMTEGISEKEAMSKFWGLSSRGLLVEDGVLRDFQAPFARSREEVSGWDVENPRKITLAEVVENTQPTILIGTSAQAGAFTEKIVKRMAEKVERPIIMPLSNPTTKAEATPENLINWTDGRALIATGSPFDPVEYKSTTFHIAQANNALVFPGIGLGVIVCKAEKVSDNMIAAASSAVANAVTDRRLGASLLPPINHLRSISAQVAIAVVEAAKAEGLARKEVPSPIEAVYKNTWKPIYPKVEVVDSL
ncbi:NAD-dependent malic enzyme [Propionimicrobium lymphophilum]|uniref:NAD-dependent malic enzyme n=1 Tax=Propionimicrobium lymphophilum TaxID=33012 RepID=UPI002550B82F|nr:NAD-dependent malic enzyme [Propionimicrobium lymphophilum]MDK7709793.1 NAD-dependent malic enzyme [Propionimicrobium lymphophilum]MDK7733945.1 NAD-dependent malic enzyme [Propionimicrobium lymphophilum]